MKNAARKKWCVVLADPSLRGSLEKNSQMEFRSGKIILQFVLLKRRARTRERDAITQSDWNERQGHQQQITHFTQKKTDSLRSLTVRLIRNALFQSLYLFETLFLTRSFL
jgi:hypothetical protein